MDKTKKIEWLEKAEERLAIYGTLAILPLTMAAFVGPLFISAYTDMKDIPLWLSALFILPVAVTGALFARKSFKNSKQLIELRKEWLEEVGLPKDVDFTYLLHCIAEGESRTFIHQAGNEVIVYRIAKRNGEFIVSSGSAELTEVKRKAPERPLVEETENDELWKLVDRNSTTEED